MTQALAGIGVLVTRPVEQATGMLRRLAELGARPMSFPALAIFPLRTSALDATLAELEHYDLVVFVSPTAVKQFLAALGHAWPTELPAAGVGAGTARALRQAAILRVLAPQDGADSEQLLALPELHDLTDKHVLLVRGEGGRELLADTLAARGAQISHAVCYRRGRAEIDPTPLLAALDAGALHALTVMSSETLDHLLALAGAEGRERLLALPLFAPHARIVAHARDLGFVTAIATAAGEDGMLAGLVEYFRHA